jgi:flagellum-specific peptidoglycan hydrolase FlgJ
MAPEEFLKLAVQAANEAAHPWPEHAACEAALESAWGESKLAKEARNLFGEKKPKGDKYPFIKIATHEVLHGLDVVVNADWPIFPDWTTSFFERMCVLRRLAPFYKHYENALCAKDGETFVREVSKSWATDPNRADKVLAIHAKHFPKKPEVN